MPDRPRILDLASRSYYALPADETVEQAVERLRAGDRGPGVFYCYAVEPDGRLAGVVSVRRLITAPPGTQLRAILSGNVIALPAGADASLLQDFFATYRFLAFPVVDAERRLVGVVQADAFTDELLAGDFEGRVRGDWLRSMGVTEEEERATPLRIVRLRLPWLLFNVAGGLSSAFIAGLFEGTTQRIVAVSFFVPIVLILAESVGVQTSTVVVAALSGVAEPRLRKLVAREVAAAAVLGLACGAIVAVVSLAWLRDPGFSLLLLGAMTLTITVASALAGALPALFRRLRIDPHLAAAPITLALTDNLTLFAYLALASRLAA